MNKKTIMIVVVILLLVATIALGFILANLLQKDRTINNENDIIKNNVIEKTDEKVEEKPQNVLINSNIGIKITENVLVPNIFSELLDNELTAKGLTNKYMLTYSFVQATTNPKYSTLVREGEEYFGGYITANDLKILTKKIFADSSNIVDSEVLISDIYDKEKATYSMAPYGFNSEELTYVVNIPYEIKEYKDKVEVYMYKLYITRKTDAKEKTIDVVYFDAKREKKATDIIDEKMYAENTQVDFLRGQIDNNTINKEATIKIKVILKKQNGEYLVQKYE